MKNPEEIAEEIVFERYSEGSPAARETVTDIAAAIQAERDEREKRHSEPCVSYRSSSDRPTCIWLKDGTKIVIKRDGNVAWLAVENQAEIKPLSYQDTSNPIHGFCQECRESLSVYCEHCQGLPYPSRLIEYHQRAAAHLDEALKVIEPMGSCDLCVKCKRERSHHVHGTYCHLCDPEADRYEVDTVKLGLACQDARAFLDKLKVPQTTS